MRLIATIALLLSTAAYANGGYFRYPALHGDTLVFTAEGDLWRVSAAGGDAQRLTTHAGAETHAAISPDGQWIAYTASYEGPAEAYVMPLTGGVPKRLTWYGARVDVVGWSPRGEVLVSTRYLHPLGRSQLVAVSLTSGAQSVIPLENAQTSVFLDASTLVFTRDNQRADNVRGYRGGAVTTLWRFDPGGGSEAVALTPPTANSAGPMAWKGRVVSLSDRDGVTNLWSMNREGRDLRQHTRHSAFEVRRAAIAGDRVAYQLGADLRLLDLASGQDRVVPIRLVSDFDQQRERWIRQPLIRFGTAELSGNGERMVVVARGRAVTAGIGSLRRVDLALPPASRARNAVFMPDGKSVLVTCDASGENELWLFPADGSAPGRQLTRDADTMRWSAVPSPDGKWIAHYDHKQRLWLLDVASGQNRLLDQGAAFGRFNFGRVKWSPDGTALALEFAEIGNQGRYGVVLLRIADGKRFTVASHRYESYSPSFSPDGRWLWFLSNRHFEAIGGTPWGERNMGPFFDRRTRAYAIALQPGNRFPFQPRDELTPAKPVPAPPAATEGEAAAPAAKPAPVKPVPIVWEGIEQRLFEVPLAPGNYTRLESDGRRLWYLEAETTLQRRTSLKTLEIGNSGAQPQVFLPEIRQFALSGDGRKLLLRKWAGQPQPGTPADPDAAGNPGDLYIVDAAPKPPPAADLPRFLVRLNDWQFSVLPREDWQQIFTDAWRMHRDWFYDPHMHGVDWPALRRKYEALLPRVTDREELSDLIAQMSAELSLLHSQVRFGDLRRGEDVVQPASLGAAFEDTAQGVRITRVYQGDPELVSSLPPLARPEAAAKAGEFIAAVDGRPVKTVVELNARLRQKAGRQVLLELRSDTGAARQVIVVPVPALREAEFKRIDWAWQRRERVEAASKGRFGYVHLRAMGTRDLADFARDFYPVIEREGLITRRWRHCTRRGVGRGRVGGTMADRGQGCDARCRGG